MKNNLLTTICLVLTICSITYAQNKPPCVAEIEKMLIEAENTESYEKLSDAKADECVGQNPKSVEAFILRSRIFVLKEGFTAAIAHADLAIKLAPNSSDAFHARGFARHKNYVGTVSGKNQDKITAIADYEKALQINPKNGVALRDLTALKSEGDLIEYRTLLPDFNRAIEYLTASGNMAELARAYYERGRAGLFSNADDTIKDYTMALKLRPNYLLPLGRRASAYHKYKEPSNLEAAIADYTEYLKIKPSAGIYTSRAAIYEERGEKAQAINDYRAALVLDPNNSTAKGKLAKLAPTTATPSQPTTTSSPKPSTAEQFAAEGNQKVSQNDYDGAIKSFSECLRLKPEAVDCLAFRGFAHGMKGDQTAAKPDFEAAIKLAPNQPEIYLMRGMTFVRLGNKVEAVKDFRTVLRINPNNREAKDALQRLGEQP